MTFQLPPEIGPNETDNCTYDRAGVPTHRVALTDSATQLVLGVLHKTPCCIVGGSLALQHAGFPVRPKDIDVLVVTPSDVGRAVKELEQLVDDNEENEIQLSSLGPGGGIHCLVKLPSTTHPIAVDFVARDKVEAMYTAHKEAYAKAALEKSAGPCKFIAPEYALLFKIWAWRPKDVLLLRLILGHTFRMPNGALIRTRLAELIAEHLGVFATRLYHEELLNPLFDVWSF